MSCFESEQSHTSREYEKNLIENLSKAFAMPIMPSSSPVVHIKCPRLYLPCTILDHRVMNGEWQYKVLFEEDVLEDNQKYEDALAEKYKDPKLRELYWDYQRECQEVIFFCFEKKIKIKNANL